MKSKSKKIGLDIVRVFMIGLIIILVLRIVQNRKISEPKTYEEVREELHQANEVEQEQEQEAEIKIPQIDFEKLKQTNPDIIGWLDIPGTAISYPIVQNEDNDYYLTHSFEKEESVAGSIYMDFRNDKAFEDQNTIIYGHDMKNGSMFHNLRYFRDQAFVDTNHTIWVVLENEIREYEILSVYPTEADYDYRTPNYKDAEKFEDFVKRILDRSIVDSLDVTKFEDKILTLSTCAYDFDDGRLAVHAGLKHIYTKD